MNDKFRKTLEQISGVMSVSWKLISLFLGTVALVVTLRLAPLQLQLSQLESTVKTVEARTSDTISKYEEILKWMLKIESRLGKIEGKIE